MLRIIEAHLGLACRYHRAGLRHAREADQRRAARRRRLCRLLRTQGDALYLDSGTLRMPLRRLAEREIPLAQLAGRACLKHGRPDPLWDSFRNVRLPSLPIQRPSLHREPISARDDGLRPMPSQEAFHRRAVMHGGDRRLCHASPSFDNIDRQVTDSLPETLAISSKRA